MDSDCVAGKVVLMMKLTVHVRRVAPGSLELYPNELVHVLVDGQFLKRRADQLAVGDIVASHGVITNIMQLGEPQITA